MQILRRAVLVLIASMFVVYAVLAFRMSGQVVAGYSDFISAYSAAKILQRGEALRLYDLQLQHEVQRETAPDVSSRAGALPFVRPPFEAWLFRPLAAFSYQVAFLLWTATSVVLLALAMLVLRREVVWLSSVPSYLLMLGALSFFPVFLTLLQGQDSILLLLIYVLTFAALRRQHPFMAGAILALGLFKFTLVLPFFVAFLVRRNVRFLAGFGAVSALLIAVSIATVGTTGAGQYVTLLARIDTVAPGVNVARDMPNLRGLIGLLMGGNSSTPSMVILVVASAAVLVLAAVKWSAEPTPSLPIDFSLNLVATVLVSYHAHVFDLSLLIIPIWVGVSLLLSPEMLDGRTRQYLTWSVGVAAFSPVYLILLFRFHAGALAVILLGLALVWIRTLRLSLYSPAPPTIVRTTS